MGNTRTIALIISAVILAGAIIGAAIYLAGRTGEQDGLAMEANATVGMMPGVDLDERRQQLQAQLDDSMIAFSVNTNPLFSAGTGEGNLMLENPGNNAKLLTARIVLKNGDQIYESDAIAPGSYLEKVKLDKQLSAGDYEATVYLNAYREDTHELIGQTGAAVTLTVEP